MHMYRTGIPMDLEHLLLLFPAGGVISSSSHGYVDLGGYEDGYEGFAISSGSDSTPMNIPDDLHRWVWAVFVQKRGLIDVVTDKSIGRHVLLGARSHAPIVVFVQKLGLLVDYLSNESRHKPR